MHVNVYERECATELSHSKNGHSYHKQRSNSVPCCRVPCTVCQYSANLNHSIKYQVHLLK